MSYSAAFKDHLSKPRHAGELPDANAVAESTNPVCGDRLRMTLRVSNGRITGVGFLAYGCPPTLVCGSALSSKIKGVTVQEALQITKRDLLDQIGGLPSRKQHAAALAIETLRIAIESACSTILP
jgi:NifU-like protein involved in Fe-S cluster formation